MTTVNGVVDTALRKAGLIAEGAVGTGYQAERGLSVFNDLMHKLVGKGFAFTDSAGTAITFADMELSDDFPIADTYRSSIKYLMLPGIVEELGGEITPSAAAEMRPSYSILYAAFGPRSEATMDATLTRQVRYY